MTTCLVTGGSGFIGSHLVEALLARGDAVRVLDNLSTGNAGNLEPFRQQIEFIEGDIRDEAAVGRAVKGVDTIFHEAALASVPRSVAQPLDSHAHCCTGTVVLLDQARQAGVRRLVYAASSSAYGDLAFSSKRETDMPMPLSPYAAAKLAGEMYCQAFYRTYGLETVCLRYFNVFGPRQDPSGPYAAVIPIFIKKLLQGEAPVIYGDGKQSRDFNYVGNVVQANLLASQVPDAAGRCFNVGTGNSVSLLDILERLTQLLGKKIAPEFHPTRTGDVRDSLADISQTRQVLGYVPATDLEEGLRHTVAFYRQQAESPQA